MKFIKNKREVFESQQENYWWRNEFQNQERTDLHMIVLFKDHLQFDTGKGIKQIDRICTYKFPPEDSELHGLVTKCQQ